MPLQVTIKNSGRGLEKKSAVQTKVVEIIARIARTDPLGKNSGSFGIFLKNFSRAPNFFTPFPFKNTGS
jgi:hypothetical protein